MKSARSPWLPWSRWGDLFLAAVFGLLIFIALSFASFGVLASLGTIAVVFLIFASINYIVWGRAESPPTPAAKEKWLAQEPVPLDTVAVELTEDERLELVALLEQSMA